VHVLTADDFVSPPPDGTVVCAYENNSRYGQLIVQVQPMGKAEYEARYVKRDPANTRKVPDLGEDARFGGCGDFSVYSGGLFLGLGIQYSDCRAVGSLVSLARAALSRL
jgi:hypothetical protein